jgi:phosphatidylinositol-3-phosphatase
MPRSGLCGRSSNGLPAGRPSLPGRFLGISLALAVLSACTSPSGGASSTAVSPPHTPSPSDQAFSRVIVIVMENKDFDQVIGAAEAPYMDSLADRYGLALNYHAVTHPSLPNYLALLGGSTFGIRSNCTDCHVDAPNLVDTLEDAGISWKAYMEGLPSPCYAGALAGRYAKKHNPFMYFDSITNDFARCSKVVPFDQLDRDLAGSSLPRFVWITPDLCHDMHDCSISQGDGFLKGLIPRLLPTLGRDGVLFLTFDESSVESGQDGGRVATIVAGPTVHKGIRSDTRYTHYSLLHTVEESWGLSSLVHSPCACTLSMSAFFGPSR